MLNIWFYNKPNINSISAMNENQLNIFLLAFCSFSPLILTHRLIWEQPHSVFLLFDVFYLIIFYVSDLIFCFMSSYTWGHCTNFGSLGCSLVSYRHLDGSLTFKGYDCYENEIHRDGLFIRKCCNRDYWSNGSLFDG